MWQLCTCGGKEKCIWRFGGKNLGEREHTEEQGINREYYKMNLEEI
jgi:hypothetical protein